MLSRTKSAARWQLSVNQTSRPFPRKTPIHVLFEKWARATPDSPAISFEGEVMSYRQLNERANRVARQLGPLIGKRSVVAVLCDRSADAIVTLLAILKAGAAYQPLSSRDPIERLRYEVENAEATLILAQASMLQSGFPGPVPVVRLDDLDQQDGPADDVASGVDADSLAYVMYTSGSTGRPKGVAVTHRNVVRLVSSQEYVRFGPSEVFLQFAPLAFDASTFEIWGPLLNGSRLAIAPPGPLGLRELEAVIEQEQVTTVWLTAGLFQAMVESQLEGLSRVRQVLTGGDVVSPSHVQRLLEAPGDRLFVNGYGPTETTTFACCHHVPTASEVESPLPIGRPIANTQVFILDADGRPVFPGEEGEIEIAGDGVARGYVNLPDLTEERFRYLSVGETVQVRTYRTGDLARFRPDGTIDFIGRRDQQVKVSGFRIELGEVEEALRRQAAVQQAVALAVTGASGEKSLVAYAVAGGPQPSVEELRASLRSVLPDYMIPSRIVFVEELPLTPAGKVDRRALDT